jgi:hypothetical protein
LSESPSASNRPFAITLARRKLVVADLDALAFKVRQPDIQVGTATVTA